MTDALHLADIVADADLVITGEGRIDSQTVHGKVPVGVARVAKRYNLPVIGIAGSLTADVGVVHQHGLDAVFSVIYSVCTTGASTGKCRRKRTYDGEKRRRRAENGPAIIGFSPVAKRRPGLAFYIL